MSGGYSYNGWPANSDPNAINVVPFGDAYGLPFPGGVRDGDVKTVLGYVGVQLHERVEPCVYGWDWGYSYRANVNNPSSLSCHASGTAIDYNAPNHPNGASGTFTNAQVATIRDILVEVGGAVQWGGDYTGTTDEMHFEIIVDADYLHSVALTLPATGPAPIPPDPEEINVALIVKRENGAVDWAWSDDMRLLMRIPTENYYKNLEFAGVIDVGHGSAPSCDSAFIDWFKGVVAGAGGTIFEPAQ